MAVVCSPDTCEYCRDSECHHPNHERGLRLPTLRLGQSCIWGRAPLDPADMMRAILANSEAREQ